MVLKKHLSILYTCFFLLFISHVANGQNNSLLWEISGNGLGAPSYLFGTIHIKDKRVFQFSDSVMIAFNNCKTQAGELVLENTNQQEVVDAIRMPADTTLKMLISRRDYNFVRKTIRKKHGVLYTLVINKIKPVYTAMMLLEDTKKEKEEKKDEMKMFLDQFLQELGKEKQMKIAGLETATEQMAALEVMSLKEQAQLLVSELRNSKPGDTEFQLEDMIKAYLTQDLDELYAQFIQQDMPEELNKSLLLDRNYRMAERMVPLMNEQPTFTAVGAAHLPGEFGLISLLRKKGYQVRAVK